MTDTIQFPVAKACAGIAASGISCVTSKLPDISTFFPNTLGGWLSVAASSVATIYTIHLLGEWYWKKVVKPYLAQRKTKRR